MNVRSLLQNGVLNQSINDFNNRQVLGNFFKIFAFFGQNRPLFFGVGRQSRRFFFDNLAELHFQTFLILFQNRLNARGRSEPRPDFQISRFFYELNRLKIFRIKHRDFKRLSGFFVSNYVVGSRYRFRNDLQNAGVDFFLFQIDVRHAQNIGLEFNQILFADNFFFHQNLAQLLARLNGFLFRFFKLRRSRQFFVKQKRF
ncbi:MAG: hypothetical protein UX55_C0044G0008 [Candidatus Azambacteria bacterium GW2011_GWE2_46_45]|uniref:Uncharacterized protein n=1 Tax=Candidatus Azambacteria bacterium GW2011_GWE2_46_45 TaxID=1618625 RepID=A0A0G1Q245_9BACT|nr:MAG: hypothetical protein UX55_C0044G0008 [Candidatus Azambacteria bacterium GW2011_GWE2_46_45]